MTALHISVVVSQHTRTIENTLIRQDLPLEPAEAVAHRARIEQWLEAMPVPGQQPRRQPADPASQQAAQLAQILRGRNPALFPDEDPEGIASEADGRPYDQARLEEAA